MKNNTLLIPVFLLFLLACITITGCGGDSAIDASIELRKAISAAAVDGVISEAECSALKAQAEEEGAPVFKSQEEWISFLESRKPRRVEMMTVNCAADTQAHANTCPAQPKSVNLILENSRSMYGYLDKDGSLSRVLSDYVLQFEQHGQDFNLSLINDQFYDIGKLDGLYKGSKDIFERKRHFEDYLSIKRLEQVGKVGESKIYEILNLVTKRAVAECEIQILVSDYIYSLSGADMEREMNTVKSNVSLLVGRLEAEGLGTLVIKYNSKFNGRYFPYDSPNKGFVYKGNRPYYIWIFGNPDYLKAFLQDYSVTKQTGYENHILLIPESKQALAHGIFPKSGQPFGEFRKDPKGANPVLSLSNVRPSGRQNEGGIRLAVGVNMTSLPSGKDYIANVENYEIDAPADENWQVVEVIPIEQGLHQYDDHLIPTVNPSHLIIIEGDDVSNKSSELTIKLRDRMPDWFASSTTNDDRQPNIESVSRQTFGFSYLAEGIWDAFHDRADNQYFLELPITLNR